MQDVADPHSAEAFKLEFLQDAAFEDFQGLWEPMRRLRQSGATHSDEQAAAIAEAVLRDLLDAELIYLFRCTRQDALATAINDAAARLSRKEVEIEIGADWWRVRPASRANVWVATTDAGDAAALALEIRGQPHD
jgi:hypothetical protein